MTGLAVGCGLSAPGFSPDVPAVPGGSLNAVLLPATSDLAPGQTLEQTTNWSSFLALSNYTTTASGESIATVVPAPLGDAASLSDPLADGEVNHFSVTVTDTGGTTRVFATTPRMVIHAAAPTLDSPIADQSFVIDSGDFTVDLRGVFGNATSYATSGGGSSIDGDGHTLRVSDDALLDSVSVTVTGSNSAQPDGDTDDVFTVDVTVAPSASIAGLDGAIARIGTHGSLSAAISAGTITARKWGSTAGGTEFGTGTSPTDFASADAGTLHLTVTVDGQEYTDSASIAHVAPVAAGGIADQSFVEDSAISVLNVAADFTGGGLTYALAPASAPLPTGLSLAGTGQITGTPTTPASQVSIVVRATNSGGFDDTGFGTTITAGATAPAQMAPPSLVVDGVSQITATLAGDPAAGGSAITGYDLRISENGTTWTTHSDVTSPHSVPGLPDATEHFIQTRAVNAIGAGPWSASAAATTDAVSITANLTPATSPIYDGQSLSDMTGYGAMTAPGNFASTGGSIASAVVSFTGDATSAGAALSEAQTAGFSVLVTDTSGNSQSFATTLSPVEYKVRVLEVAGAQAQIEVNPLAIAADDTVDVTISGGTSYDDTYTDIPAGAFASDAAPYAFADTVRVTHAGLAADLATGSTMTHDFGLWATSTGSLTLSGQAQSDGVDIPGATGATYDLTGAELDADYTLEIRADDGTNAPVTVESAAIAVPAPSAGGLPSVVGIPATFAANAAGGSLAYPAGHAAGQIAVLALFQSSDNAIPSVPGFAQLTSLEGNLGANGIEPIFYTRTLASGTEANVIIPAATRQQGGILMVFRDAASVGVLGSGSVGIIDGAGGENVSFESGVTAGADSLCLMCIADAEKTDASNLASGPGNAALANITPVALAHTSLNRGGGLEIFSGEKPVAGNAGTTTATLNVGANWAGIMLEVLK